MMNPMTTPPQDAAPVLPRTLRALPKPPQQTTEEYLRELLRTHLPSGSQLLRFTHQPQGDWGHQVTAITSDPSAQLTAFTLEGTLDPATGQLTFRTDLPEIGA